MAVRAQPLLDAWNAIIDALALLQDLYRPVEDAQIERRERGLEVIGPFVTHRALAKRGFDATLGQARQIRWASAVGLHLWGWRLYADTLDTLHKLRAMPVKTGLVSNSYYTVDARIPLLEEIHLTENLFDAFMFSADVKRPKPRSEPFVRGPGDVGPSRGCERVHRR